MVKAFISYQEKRKDGSEETIEGIFDLIEDTEYHTKFSSNKNVIKIPSRLINKVKIQELKGGN